MLNALVVIGAVLLYMIVWFPWNTFIQWVKEEVRKPNRNDVL
jgi:hypothetical protein